MGSLPLDPTKGNGTPASTGINGANQDPLARIEARLARIEAQLERLPVEANALVATATDALDRATESAGERGIDVDARIHRAAGLVEELSNPRVMDALEELIGFAKDGKGLVATAIDSVDEGVAALDAQGIDVQRRASRAVRLLERLTHPNTMAALERGVELATEGEALAATAIDTVDAHIAALEDRGVDVQSRLNQGLRLVEQLTAPGTMSALERGVALAADAEGLISTIVDTFDGQIAALQARGIALDERAATLARLAERMTSPAVTENVEEALAFAADAKNLTSTAVDTLDSAIAALSERGVDVDDRARRLARIAEKATHPAALEALEELVEMLPDAKGLISTAVDTFDTYANQIVESGMNLQTRMTKLGVAVDRLTKEPVLELLEQVTERTSWFQKVVESTLLSRETSRVLLAAVQSVEQTASSDPPEVGAFGALRWMGNRDVKRAVGFSLRLAATLGARLKADELPPCELPE